jgi:Peptidase of plants and bacteria
MKKHILITLFLSVGLTAFAQQRDTIKKDNLALIFVNTDVNFSKVTKQRLIDAFFIVFPEEMAAYNKNSSTLVTFVIDTAYKGVAATSRDIVRFNPTWFVKNPEDIDVVTHEVMHIVQNYGRSRGPGWLTEGIADYARNQFGINNAKSGWKLTEYKEGQSYILSYRITARFLLWAVKHKDPKLVYEMDAALRDGKYTPDMWQQLTGKNVDDLWKEYSENPVI